ncbi:WD40-repeat-containing domain protein [Geopyxis carbonaria]|nr:WD40-repeat-containing domain protein [Geopyxis carbonaria]
MAESMITATAWVPRGFAAQYPKRLQIDEAEFDRIAELAKLQLEDAQEDLEEAKAEEQQAAAGGGVKIAQDDEMEVEDDDEEEPEKPLGKEDKDDDLREYNLDNYDEPTEEEKAEGQSMGMFGNVKSLAYHQPGEEDPYITLKDDDDAEEREELQILDSDNLLVVGKVEDEVAHLEVYVYEDEADNLYVHHDIMLPAIPLCLEWLDLPVNTIATDKDARGNFIAIGTTDPDIEIWNLDVVDSMFPDAILGAKGDEKTKKKKKKKVKANDNYHVGAVQALAGNRQHRNLLASGSADKTLKLWDLTMAKCAQSYSYHTDQVCAIAWNPTQATTILSGSYDRTVVWADMRAPDAKMPRWGVESDVEHIKWDPHDNNYFYVSTEAGLVHFHDTRVLPASPADTKPVWTLQAHDKAVSSFDINPIIPGFLATGSMDKTVKLWNTQTASGGPSMVVSRDMDVGKVFATNFAPDAEVGFRLAVAGSKGVVTVWDTSTNAGVRRAFGDRVKSRAGKEDKEDRMVLPDAASDSESESGEDDDEDDDAEPDGWSSEED